MVSQIGRLANRSYSPNSHSKQSIFDSNAAVASPSTNSIQIVRFLSEYKVALTSSTDAMANSHITRNARAPRARLRVNNIESARRIYLDNKTMLAINGRKCLE